jgi:hypothetical protein
MSRSWRPTERDELQHIIHAEPVACTPERQAVFEKHRGPSRKALSLIPKRTHCFPHVLRQGLLKQAMALCSSTNISLHATCSVGQCCHSDR